MLSAVFLFGALRIKMIPVLQKMVIGLKVHREIAKICHLSSSPLRVGKLTACFTMLWLKNGNIVHFFIYKINIFNICFILKWNKKIKISKVKDNTVKNKKIWLKNVCHLHQHIHLIKSFSHVILLMSSLFRNYAASWNISC